MILFRVKPLINQFSVTLFLMWGDSLLLVFFHASKPIPRGPRTHNKVIWSIWVKIEHLGTQMHALFSVYITLINRPVWDIHHFDARKTKRSTPCFCSPNGAGWIAGDRQSFTPWEPYFGGRPSPAGATLAALIVEAVGCRAQCEASRGCGARNGGGGSGD